MNKLFDYLLREPNMLLSYIWGRLGTWIPDDIYLKVRYRLVMKRPLRLDNPQTFNEKINWLKLYNRQPLYTSLVDKSTVKDYVKNIIGDEYVIPTLGVWEKFDDIDFSILPIQFVLKSTNGGGGTGVVVCKNKSNFDKVEAKKRLETSMRTNFKIGREWVYTEIKPRIIAEKLLSNSDGSELVDYKIFCFNGEPKLLFLASDRYAVGESLKFDWYDIDLNHLPFKSKGYETTNKEFPVFPEFEQMKEVARQLSQGIPFVRVDLYLVDHKIYFGELTFFHDGGFVPLEPEEWEYKLGAMIQLPVKYTEK